MAVRYPKRFWSLVRRPYCDTPCRLIPVCRPYLHCFWETGSYTYILKNKYIKTLLNLKPLPETRLAGPDAPQIHNAPSSTLCPPWDGSGAGADHVLSPH